MAPRILALHVLMAICGASAAQSPGEVDRPPPGMHLTSFAVEDLVIGARREMMAFRFDTAEAIFETLLNEPGNDEAALYHLTGIVFLRAMFAQAESGYDDFYRRSDQLDDLLDDQEESAWRLFFEGDNYLMRSLVKARQGDYLRAAISAREAYELYLDALRMDRTLIDAEMGVGFLKAMIAATPPAYKRFLKLLGYEGTISEGLRLLDHAAQKSRYNRDQAALFRDLTHVYMNYHRAAATERLGSQFESSKNPGTGLMYAFALRYARRPEEAVRVAREAIAIQNAPGYSEIPFLYYHLGSALFSLNRFEEAVPPLKYYVNTFEGLSYRASARLRLGLALEMLDRRAEAEAVYANVKAPTDFDIDLASQRKAEKLKRKPLSEFAKRLLRGANAVNSERHDEAIAELEPVFYGPEANQLERTEAAYYLGRSYHVNGQLGEAATKYVYVRTHPVGKNERWAAWATYYLGRIRASQGRKAEAKELFEEVQDFKGDYDFKKSLRRNARLAADGY